MGFEYSEERDIDPFLVLEKFMVDMTQEQVDAAIEKQLGWIANRKSAGLSLMRVDAIPWSKRYRFLLAKQNYRKPFRTDEMKRREAVAPGTTAIAGVTDAKWAKQYPTLWEYMTTLNYEDGGAREVSKLSIFVENGVMKAALNDPTPRASVYVAGDTVDAALKALELALASPACEWRAWNNNTKKK